MVSLPTAREVTGYSLIRFSGGIRMMPPRGRSAPGMEDHKPLFLAAAFELKRNAGYLVDLRSSACWLCGRRLDSRGEEELVGFFGAEYELKLAEREKWQEDAENNETAGGQLVDAKVVDDGPGGFAVDEAFDELLNEVEREDEQAEKEGANKDGLVERAGLGAFAEMEHFADENDFADDEGVNDCEGVVQFVVDDAVLAKGEPGIGDKDAEENGQIE